MKSHSVKVPLFRPFKYKLFRHLCLANFMANIGSWMQIFATGWLVASQTKDPSVAVMAQTLTQIPIFLFSILAGVMADRFNTYRYLGGVNIGMAISAVILAIFCLISVPSINIIFLFTFLTATGTALKASVWQASMSSMVEHNEIESAATLNGLSYNLASIIGPILGSLLFGMMGPSLLYFTNALCLSGLAIIYFFVHSEKKTQPNHNNLGYFSLFLEGVRVSFNSNEFRRILFITALIFFSISIFHALLPIYVNNILQGSSNTLGLLMGGFGTGAVISAFISPTLRSLFPRHILLALAAFIYGISLLAFSFYPILYFILPVAVIAGFVWATIVSTMNSAAQGVFDATIRARALSIYSMCFYGSLTIGSLTWGIVSEYFTITSAFFGAGLLMVLNAFYVFRAC